MKGHKQLQQQQLQKQHLCECAKAMEPSKSKALVVSASTPSESLLPLSQPDSQLSLLLFDVSQQVQVAMENMLKLIGEIDQSSAGIMEDIERSKESSVERKKILEEERERFQKAAFTVLEMLNTGDNN